MEGMVVETISSVNDTFPCGKSESTPEPTTKITPQRISNDETPVTSEYGQSTAAAGVDMLNIDMTSSHVTDIQETNAFSVSGFDGAQDGVDRIYVGPSESSSIKQPQWPEINCCDDEGYQEDVPFELTKTDSETNLELWRQGIVKSDADHHIPNESLYVKSKPMNQIDQVAIIEKEEVQLRQQSQDNGLIVHSTEEKQSNREARGMTISTHPSTDDDMEHHESKSMVLQPYVHQVRIIPRAKL